ncbi:MAG: hypothetical protein HN704_18470 [Bacteroidetes bacterium]|jgi:hypothetical protein|nr:hypothetical protein [Bacteroidota bacterium]MBT6686082.1 hypothetical protein [Bacteroidota bacterium]MBT7142025.1 hypothetical protein [Bacteroidota bacterium]MBT7493589.1 hypothetical protein [Bacteroidota bacterium]
MKNLKIIFLFSFSIILLLNSCKKDDDEYKYNFEDQELSGQIAGESWTYETGGVFISDFNHPPLFDFRIFGTDTISPCSYNIASRSLLFFTPMEIGLYDIADYLVTFYAEGEETENLITVLGAFEILTIDTANKIITGRMDAKYDDDNFVNGNFSLTSCY